jgi:hypothetical protein
MYILMHLFCFQLRDAVAFVAFMSRLEREVKYGIKWTEMTAAKELLRYRRSGQRSLDPSVQVTSFANINAVV